MTTHLCFFCCAVAEVLRKGEKVSKEAGAGWALMIRDVIVIHPQGCTLPPILHIILQVSYGFIAREFDSTLAGYNLFCVHEYCIKYVGSTGVLKNECRLWGIQF